MEEKMKRNNEPNEVILLDAVRAIIALDTETIFTESNRKKLWVD